jgi:hypothetical protein
MYPKLMDEATRELYGEATSDSSLDPEIRVLRARLGIALAAGDDKLVMAVCGIVARLLRTQADMGRTRIGVEDILDEVGESIVAEEEARANPIGAGCGRPAAAEAGRHRGG